MTVKRKKSRKSRSRRGKPSPDLTLEQRTTQARELLGSGKYREAIAAFKALLRDERRDDWSEALAEAFVGRARALAAKGMIKEAIVMWRNRAETCNRSLAEPDFLALLFQNAQFDEARRLIREHLPVLDETGNLPRVRELCAAQLLAGQIGLLDVFPEYDPLRRDYPSALTALEAYCQQRDDAVQPALRALPFRSPFRDFRQLVKALALRETDVSTANTLLSRVDASSPFHSLARAIAASLMPAPDYLRQFGHMGKAERRLSAALRGIPEQQLGTVHELQQLGDTPESEKLLRFLLRHRETLGDGFVSESAKRLLVHFPRLEGLYVRSLGRMSTFDQLRIEALRVEAARQHPCEEADAWHDVCLVIDRPDLQPGAEDAMLLATVLRRMADRWLAVAPPDPPVFAALERALECDPEDSSTRLRLIRLYLSENRARDARRLLEPALQQYPDDTAILTAAVETAISSGAFKKASRYARQVLELDPINPAVRDILCGAHYSHAGKLIRQKKHSLAHRELTEADNWARSDEVRGRIDFARAILSLDESSPHEAHRLFQSGYERCGGGLAGRFQLLVAGGRLGHHMQTVLKRARLPKLAKKADREQIMALVKVLGDSADGDDDVLDALDLLEKPLAGAARLDFSQGEMTHLCETWLRLDHQDLRTRYACAALKRWPDLPVFVFHQIDARRRSLMMPRPEDFERLEAAFDRAHAQGDMRTAHRIEQMLTSGPLFSQAGDPDFDPLFREDELPPLPTGRELDLLIDDIIAGAGPPFIEELKRQLPAKQLKAALRDLLTSGPAELLPEVFSPDEPPQARRRTPMAAAEPDSDQLDLF